MYKIFLFLIGFIFISCSPKYEVKTIYKLPETEDGKKCISQCQIQYEFCKKECNQNYQKCLNSALKRAKEIYKEAEKDYQIKFKKYYREYSLYTEAYRSWLNKYERTKSDFEYYSRKCSIDKKWCDEKNYYSRLLSELYSHKPKEPFKPQEPSFEKILQVQQSKCDKECGCKNEYDTCFQSCGGKIEYKKICVENCK